MIKNPIILNAIRGDVTRLLLLSHIQWPSGDIFTHTRTGEKRWNNITWIGVGDYASISGAQSGNKAGRLNMSLQLPGPAFVSEANEEGIIGRQVKLYLGALDEKRRVAAAELISFKLIADVGIEHDPVSIISLMCASHRERFRSAQDYLSLSANAWRERFPSDSYCDDVDAIAKGPLNTYSGSERLGTVRPGRGGNGGRGVGGVRP